MQVHEVNSNTLAICMFRHCSTALLSDVAFAYKVLCFSYKVKPFRAVKDVVEKVSKYMDCLRLDWFTTSAIKFPILPGVFCFLLLLKISKLCDVGMSKCKIVNWSSISKSWNVEIIETLVMLELWYLHNKHNYFPKK